MDSGYYPLKLSAASSSVEQDSLIVFIDTPISWEMAMLVKDSASGKLAVRVFDQQGCEDDFCSYVLSVRRTTPYK